MHLKTSVTFLASVLLAQMSFAQLPVIDVGSDGSYGEINITADTTLDIPEDGIFHATTVTITEGATLRFNRNIQNTPVYILAQGEIEVAGTIDLSGTSGNDASPGQGGPGGFDGGRFPGDGFGPGGGANGSDLSAGEGKTAQNYGSRLLIPLIGGSGGGSRSDVGKNGGGGGGALLLASNASVTTTGALFARGVEGPQGSNFRKGWKGGNGSLRVVAPTVAINNNISSNDFAAIRFDRFVDNSTGSIVGLTVGSNFVIFPEPAPTLEVVEIAGEVVDLGTGIALIQPPAGSDPNTTIKIRASNFGKSVPISIVLQPETGSRTVIETTIDNSTEDPVTQEYDITLPVNLSTQVFVWTR